MFSGFNAKAKKSCSKKVQSIQIKNYKSYTKSVQNVLLMIKILQPPS